ncbi:hypothetical protein DYB32_000011 [Aphanomyces invadans]|uniref:non-specific serine/threonine protein kinase n=1 Tax=Aphanomyces invadans TaxID=157072 RepID=A0A3R6VIV8_9STRA|nr:hypothetical protein DYB32_000011 [Aphanomyces invadans]
MLMSHLITMPHSALLFQVLNDLITHAQLFQLALPLPAPVGFQSLAAHPLASVRRCYLNVLPSIEPHPAHLPAAVERLFDSDPDLATTALHTVGKLALASLGDATPSSLRTKLPRWHVPSSIQIHGTFGPAQFEALLQWLETGESYADCLAMLRLQHHSTPLLALKSSVCDAAKWCVWNRLRTHWGNAGQTFAALEKLLWKPVVHQPRLVLELLHALEMTIFHVQLETPTTPLDESDDPHRHQQRDKAIAFFKTNRKVCDEWFFRIRPSLIRLCDSAGASVVCRHHALSLVTSMHGRKTGSSEWDSAMFALCSASCDLQDTPGLQGYIQYAARIDQTKPWMEPLLLEAQMQYEAATAGYDKIVSPLVQLARQHGVRLDYSEHRGAVVEAVVSFLSSLSMGAASFKGVVLRCAQCFAILQDWASCRLWMEQAMEVAAFLHKIQQYSTDNLDIANALRSLVSTWDAEVAIIQATDPSLVQGLPKALPPLQEWSVLTVVDDANARNLQHLDDVQAHVSWLQQRLRVLTMDIRAVAPRKGENMSRQLQRTLMQLQCFLQPGIPSTLSLNPTAHDLGVWHPLASRVPTEAVFQVNVQIVRLARKQRNFKLATSKLANLAALLSPKGTGCVEALTVGYERALLQHATNHHAEAIETLCHVHSTFAESAKSSCRERRMQVKTLMKLGAWSDDTRRRQDYLHLATTVDPTSFQAWLEWSNFWYQVSRTQLDAVAHNSHQFTMSIEDKHEFTAIVDMYSDVLQPLAPTLLGAMQNFESFECPPDVKGPALESLNVLYQKARDRVLAGYNTAVKGYVTYLQCASPASLKSHGVVVTLRLLNVLVKQGSEPSLQVALDMAITDSPLQPWERIVPQLLSRLAHPDPNALRRVEAILLRLASENPHLIVYPAVVESTNLTEALSTDLVGQVRQLIAEFRRISLLWDETWLSLLTKLTTDVARRSHTLEKEAARVEKNAFLSDADKLSLAHRKFVAMMKPVLLAVATLAKETCQSTPTTPHEHWFVLHFGNAIASALANLEQCLEGDDPALPFSHCHSKRSKASVLANPLVHHLWSPFSDILKRLHGAILRRQSLQMASISPVLASWESSLVHMPGLPALVIQGISPQVQILSTKTKPKCLEVVGSDGHSYRYLLKSREDLHLDERIMQLLSTVNVCLSSDKEAKHYDLTARHYNVIPLGTDVGLIQMVRNVTPLFQIYTGATTLPTTSAVSADHPPNTVVASPTAPFYEKLKAHGITNNTPAGRPHWPLAVLRQVFADLVSEHPKANVLVQEMMRQSRSVQEFSAKSTRFCTTVAVMSVVGYIIGLGDRHLDNMLLCHSGDLVHIDYNVCFDKGKKLKVPEIVPFRLTSIVHGALGLTGTDGRFRHSMETTLRVIRTPNAKETVLTLLEAFVYDPLVDWKEGPPPKKLWRMDMNVQLSLFSSRAQERRSEADAALAHILQTWHVVDELTTTLRTAVSNVMDLVHQLVDVQAKQKALQQQLTELESSENQDDDMKKVDEALERLYVDALEAMDRFGAECQSREDGVRQWLGLGDMGLVGKWRKSSRALTFTDVHKAVNLTDGSVEENCRLLDKGTDALKEFLTSKATRSLEPSLSWFQRERRQLYGSLRGPTVYKEWLSWISQAKSGKGVNDIHETVKAAQDDLLPHRLGMYALPLQRPVQATPSIPHRLDATDVDNQLKALTQSLTEVKTTWKLSNSQIQKVLKVAIADYWHRHSTDTVDLEDFTLRLSSVQWLSELGRTTKGITFRHLPLEKWLFLPDNPPLNSPTLTSLHNLTVAIRSALDHVALYMPAMPYGASARELFEKFRKSLCHANAMPGWSDFLASFEWVDSPVMPSLDLNLDIPTSRPNNILDLAGVWSLHRLLNVVCAIEISLTVDGNAHAIQYHWLDTLASVAWMVIQDRQPHQAAAYLSNQAATVLALASHALNSFCHTTICVQEWKFKPAADDQITQDVVLAELQHAMPIGIPTDLDILSHVASSLHLDDLVRAMATCATTSRSQATCDRHNAFIEDVASWTAQHDVLSTWLNVQPKKDDDGVARSQLLSLIPPTDNLHRHEQAIESLLEPTTTALLAAAAPHDHSSIRELASHALNIKHDTQSLFVACRWIEYVESTFRDSQSDTCRAVDAEGLRVVAAFLQAQVAWKAHTTRQHERHCLLQAQSQQRDAMQNDLEYATLQVERFRTLLTGRLDSLPDVSSHVMALKRAVPDLLHHVKTMSVIWDSERLVKILAKSIKRTNVDELRDLQNAMSTYEATSANLEDNYNAVVQAFRRFVQECPDLDCSSSTTMASVIRGKIGWDSGNNHSAAAVGPTAGDKAVGALTAVARLNSALDASTGLGEIRQAMEAVVRLFFEIADQATLLSSHERSNTNADDSSDSSSSSDDEDDSDSNDEPSGGIPAPLKLKQVQERNVFGLQVLRRVKDKLDGEASHYTVEEHVQWLIQEATSVDNLCQMYEGWMPWI